jgi:hypothetical protein
MSKYDAQRIEKIQTVIKHGLDLRELHNFFNSPDREFQLEMIELAYSTAGLIREVFLARCFASLPYEKCLAVHVRALKLACSSVKPGSSKAYFLTGYAQRLGGSKNFEGLKRADAIDLAAILIQTKTIYYGDNFFRWMSIEHLPALRLLFGRDIEKFCLERNDCDSDIFYHVRDSLNKHSQGKFAKSFCALIEKYASKAVKYCFPIEDPKYLSRIRQVIRKIIADSDNNHENLEHLGTLVAHYGEQQDIEACLKLSRSDQIIGLVCAYKINKSIKVTAEIQASMEKRAVECLCYGIIKKENPPRTLDGIFAYCLQFNLVEEIESVRFLCKLREEVFFRSDFELLVKKKKEIHKNQISYFMDSPKFPEIRYRLREVWNQLTQEAKDCVSSRYSYFNILNRPVMDPEFKEAVLSIGRRDEIMPAFEAIQAFAGICLTKVELTAHWFYVDDFELEIETGGYLGCIETASQALASV